MPFFDKLARTVQGAVFIIAGIIILLDTLGLATQIIHTIVMITAIGLIACGIWIADVIGKISRLIKKKDQPQPPVQS